MDKAKEIVTLRGKLPVYKYEKKISAWIENSISLIFLW